MPAPRLLDKKIIAASLATQQKQEIDRGVKIAKSIDALRETKAKEERDLEEFRVNTLKAVQIQIDSRKSELDQLSVKLQALKAEKLRLEGPLDLIQAWEEVHEVQSKNDSISDNLLKREISITARENDVHDASAGLFEREQEIKRLETFASENLRKSQSQREEAENANIEAKLVLARVKKDESEHNAFVESTESELERREEAVRIREEENEAERITINNEKILLADRRATLERGFAELRRKQDGTNR